MLILLISVGLAGLWGFIVSFYFFVYRLNLSISWRLPIGIVGSLIIAILMALVDFLIVWPPMDPIVTIGGLAFMILILALGLFYNPKANIRRPGHGIVAQDSEKCI